MPKVRFRLGDFRLFAANLPPEMPAIAALKAFLIAKGAVNALFRLSSVTVRQTKPVKKR